MSTFRHTTEEEEEEDRRTMNEQIIIIHRGFTALTNQQQALRLCVSPVHSFIHFSPSASLFPPSTLWKLLLAQHNDWLALAPAKEDQ